MVNSFSFGLGKTGLNAPGTALASGKTKPGAGFFRFAQTGMVHARHHTTAVTARGVMQGEEGEER